jgi:hypothetical protein
MYTLASHLAVHHTNHKNASASDCNLEGTMTTHLRHNQQALFQSLMTGKMPRNLPWNEVVELIGKLGEVQPHGDDEFAFVVGSQRAFFKRPKGHELEMEEVSRLRKFLHESGINLAATPSAAEQAVAGPTVVVIDHHAARFYEDLGGTRPEKDATIKPHDPQGFHRHLIHRKEAHYQGERVPEEASFYEEVAQHLVNAQQIILIGHGTGKSSAVEFLAEYLKKHHPGVAQRISATEIADLSALTDPEIESLARKHL